MELKSGTGLEFCIASHAEVNCINNAARHGTATLGATLYLNDVIPCKSCMCEIINAGIVEVVCTKLNLYDPQSEYIIRESCIKIRTFENAMLKF